MPVERAIQLPLPDSEKETQVIFSTNTCIFPEYGGRGYLEGPIVAKKLPYKIKGLLGFETATRPRLWYDTAGGVHHWTMNGYRFGAYSKSAHPSGK